MPTLQVTPDCNMYYDVTDFAEPWREHETILLLHGNAESGDAWYGWMPASSAMSRPGNEPIPPRRMR